MSYLLSEYTDIRRFSLQSLITRCRDPSVHHELGHYAREQSCRNFTSRSRCSRKLSELCSIPYYGNCIVYIGRFDTRDGYHMFKPFYISHFFALPSQHGVRVSPRLERKNKWELSSVDASQKVDRLLWKRDPWILFIYIFVCELFFNGHFQMQRFYYIWKSTDIYGIFQEFL